MTTRRFATRVAPITGFVLALLLGGCSSVPGPKISLADAFVSDRSDEATLVILSLDIENQADVSIPLYEFDYNVSIDGRPVFDTNRRARMTLRPSETRQMNLPVVVPHGNAGTGPRGSSALGVNGSLVYIAPGELAEILFDTGVRVPSTGFSAQRTVEFGP